MYEDIKISLNPYLGCSDNLIEFFAIIGYDEEELIKNNPNIIENQENLNLSIISIVKSETLNNQIDFNLIINQVYPDKPNIIKIIKSTKKPIESNVIFSSCFDSLDGSKKIFFSCYALRFYEFFFTKDNVQYYVPKAFLIYSQYPYFTTFYNICSIIFDFNQKGTIPIELLIHIFVNHIPSPINNNIILVNFNPQIVIPKLTGYPYIDFNLGKIFNIIPITEFIKIYILIFLEIDLLFFSSNLDVLNMSMFIFYILNYPLTDSNYLWHIKSIPKENIEYGDDTVNTSFKGVNTNYDIGLDFEGFNSLNFIIDLENKKKKFINCIKKHSLDAQETNKLLEYINLILNNKSVKSCFLAEPLILLKDKLVNVKKEYDSKFTKNIPFLFVDKNIFKINRKIQEIFYDFILNILGILYKDFKYDYSTISIKKDLYKSEEFSQEEKTFLKLIRFSVKYNTYLDLFVSNFKTIDELKLSLLFTDEYVNLKKNDIKNQLSEKIDYFQIMDNYYSLKPGEIKVNYYDLNKEFKSIKDKNILAKLYKSKKGQLFILDNSIIDNFKFYRNKGLFKSLKENANKEFIIESNNKITIPITIIKSFNNVLNLDYFIKSSLIYTFCIVFPLFPFNKNLFFFTDILYEIQKLNYFRRYYINIIIKTMNKYYLINQEKKYFPELNFENFCNYCELIRNNMLENSILPNEEIFLFFKKLKEAMDKITAGEEISNNYIFQFEKNENYLNKIEKDIIKKENNSLIFIFKGKKTKHNFLSFDIIYDMIYFIYDNYYSFLNLNIEKLDYRTIIEIIISLAYYFIHNNDLNLGCLLVNMFIALKKLEKDLKIVKGTKK